MENSFQEVLERVVLENSPELIILTHKITKGLIEIPETVVVEVNETSELYPKPPEGRVFKERNRSWATIRANVVLFNMYTGYALCEDGEWRKPSNTKLTKFELEPLPEPPTEINQVL